MREKSVVGFVELVAAGPGVVGIEVADGKEGGMRDVSSSLNVANGVTDEEKLVAGLRDVIKERPEAVVDRMFVAGVDGRVGFRFFGRSVVGSEDKAIGDEVKGVDVASAVVADSDYVERQDALYDVLQASGNDGHGDIEFEKELEGLDDAVSERYGPSVEGSVELAELDSALDEEGMNLQPPFSNRFARKVGVAAVAKIQVSLHF